MAAPDSIRRMALMLPARTARSPVLYPRKKDVEKLRSRSQTEACIDAFIFDSRRREATERAIWKTKPAAAPRPKDQLDDAFFFYCSTTGSVTDVNGNVSTCTAVVTVEDVTDPVLVCMDITLELGADGTAMITPDDVILSVDDACGINTTAIDISDFDCSDIGTPVTVTVFAIDNNGNTALCMAVVTVVDLLAPVVTCPADITVDPGPGNLFYEVPDYFALGEATAEDNCTDPLTLLSQDPAAGTLLPDGVYTITMTAEDEYGNIGTCTFELTVESVLGVGDPELNIGTIVMYPNPAKDVVMLSNPQSIALGTSSYL